MAGGSRPKRALTIRATCPGGTTNELCAAAGGGGAAGAGGDGATDGETTVGEPGVTSAAGGGAGEPIGAGGRGGVNVGSADCAKTCSGSNPAIANSAANQQRRPAVPCPRAPMCRFMAAILAF